MMQNKYDYLKSFKKEDLINFYIQKDNQLTDALELLKKSKEEQKNIIKKCDEKIKDMEARHDKQKYREWKQHVDTRYLDRYLREWLSEHLKINLESGYDGCDSHELRGGMYIDNKEISSIQTYY